MLIYNYDLETYPNIFLFCGMADNSDVIQTFEISPRKNQIQELLAFLQMLKDMDVWMQGYNNVNFDNEIIEFLINNPYEFSAYAAYMKAQEIIDAQNNSFGPVNTVWFYRRYLKQIDLSKIHGFDRKNRRTSLKHLQFNMRCESVLDLPFPIRDLTFDEMDQLISYCGNDLYATRRFGNISKPAVNMRKELLDASAVDGDVMNMADQSVGEKYVEKQIGKDKTRYKGKPIQTVRREVNFKNVVLPSIYYTDSEFNDVLEWFKDIVVKPKQKKKPKLIKEVRDLKYYFGLGGIHASVKRKSFHESENFIIEDIDVSGMYPAIAITNGFYPEHLGQKFVEVYRAIPALRKKYGKKTSFGKLFKLAANAVFGKSADAWSFLLDLVFFYRITINGQLQLWRLIEMLLKVPDLQIMQANTDGITAYIPRQMLYMYETYKTQWQQEVGLELESVRYKSMWIRDVNNYLALKTDGNTKGKGAYAYPKSLDDYEGFWYKDYSAMVVPKVTEYCMINNSDPFKVIHAFTDCYDYMIMHKSNKTMKIEINGVQQPKTLRCYISNVGGEMIKHLPAKGVIGTYKRASGIDDDFYAQVISEIEEGEWDERIHTKNKSTYQDRESSLEKGYLVKPANHIKDFDWSDLNRDYYINEVLKLMEGFEHVQL